MSFSPAVSIITPVLNRVSMMPAACASVALQSPASFEHIVIDGGSIDGTREAALDCGARLIDAPGSSLYGAINIGLTNARGEILCLLNSDDRLPAGALDAALQEFQRDASLELVRGRASVEQERNGRWIEIDNGRARDPSLRLRSVLFGPTNINACFFRPALVRRIGALNDAYAISADREWLVRVLLGGARTGSVDRTLYVYRAHAGSLTIGGDKKATAPWLREHRSFARAMLANPSLGNSVRADLRAFFGKETAHLAMLALGRGDLREARDALADAFRVDPLWPMHAARPLANVAMRRARALSS